VEFSDKDSVQTALALDDSLFKGRQIKVKILIFVKIKFEEIFRLLKNGQIVLVYQQLIEYHVVHFVDLDVVDSHVVGVICHIYHHLIEVELLDHIFGIKFIV
jgi:hypothetical protein